MLLACGAGSGSTSHVEPGDGEAKAAPAPACRSYDVDAAVTTFDGGACPWVLTRDDAVLELSSLAPDAKAAFGGEVPPECASLSCDYAGMATGVGPLVIATRRGPASEMPASAVLGFVAGDGKLTFVDLWDEAGDPVADEGTNLGPTHSLAPFDCGGKLGLFAVARTNAGEAVQAVPGLVAREGVYTSEASPAPAKRDDCDPIPLAMP